ncbi:23902_t:CDS:10, partial [Racocetra persica]
MSNIRFEIKGKQYHYLADKKNQIFRIDYQKNTQAGQQIVLDKILSRDNEFGQPYLPNVQLIAEVIKHGLNKKITVMKYKPKKRYKKKMGNLGVAKEYGPCPRSPKCGCDCSLSECICNNYTKYRGEITGGALKLKKKKRDGAKSAIAAASQENPKIIILMDKALITDKTNEKETNKDKLLANYRAILMVLKMQSRMGQLAKTHQIKQLQKQIARFLARRRKSYKVLARRRQKGTNLMLAVAVPAIILIRGVLFCLDGIVTSKLKFPLGQICFVINNCKLLVKNEKEAIIEDITEANEHCKETLKKFGALTVGDEVRGVLKIIRKTEQPGGSNLLIDILLNISYGFPLYLAYGKTTEIEKVLAKITKRLKGYFRQERRKKYEELEEPEITSEESEEEENQSRKIKIKPKRKGKKEEKEIISRFTENLNQKERIAELTIIGREEEIKQMTYVLSRMIKNNPLLIGPPGVGKTAIVEGLVQRIKRGQVPDYLKNKIIYQLNMMALMAGTKFQGDLEERLKAIFRFMGQPENKAILFIDEIHLIVGAGRSQGALDISNLLKPLLSRGEIQCLGATTQEEYRKYIEKDGALTRRFSNIYVREPSEEESIAILRGNKNNLEIYYELKIQDEALVAAVKMSQRYLTSACLPDKAVDLIDETCGRIHNHLESTDLQQKIEQQKQKLTELTQQDHQESTRIQQLNQAKKNLAQAQKDLENYQLTTIDYNKAGEIKYQLFPQLQEKISHLEQQASQNTLRKYAISPEDIAVTIAKKYDLPLGKILQEEQQKLLFLPGLLAQRIKGQDHALRVVSEAIFRARAGIQDPNRPLAAFLFVGPTGVGKTEVALTIAEQLFDQKKNLIHLDMTDFSEPHSISKLIGPPPGYIGFEEPPRLEIVREKMHSVILFDEVEKCHPAVINLLLQILDNGFLTLADGREVNFRNTILILTSNLGSELYFTTGETDELEGKLHHILKGYFRPEFLNRLNEIVFFNSLTPEVVREIISKELELFIRRVDQEKNIKLRYDQQVIEKIFREAYSPEYGARPVKKYLEKQIGSLIARGIIAQFLKSGGNYLLELEAETQDIKITTFSSFILHSGPPYANGKIHLGHVLNFLIKDIIVRWQASAGHYTPFLLGWDTHGLPIEHKMLQVYPEKKNDLRPLCYQFALEQAQIQREQLEKLGLFTDYNQYYITLDRRYEAEQLRIFGEIVKKGLVYQEKWCGEKLKVKEIFLGEKLLGLTYFHPYRKDTRGYIVDGSDFIKEGEGTGLVHLAPAFGAEDFAAAQKENLLVDCPLEPNGLFNQKIMVSELIGRHYTEVNQYVITDLEKRNLILKKAEITHMEVLKKELLENVAKVKWYPGVPIPVLYNNSEPMLNYKIIDYIANIVEKNVLGRDIMDVWLDSGVSHCPQIGIRINPNNKEETEAKFKKIVEAYAKILLLTTILINCQVLFEEELAKVRDDGERNMRELEKIEEMIRNIREGERKLAEMERLSAEKIEKEQFVEERIAEIYKESRESSQKNEETFQGEESEVARGRKENLLFHGGEFQHEYDDDGNLVDYGKFHFQSGFTRERLEYVFP